MWKRSLFSKYLDKIKIANTSNIKFLFTACKASSYLIKLITFTCTNLSPKKACEETKENKEVVSNWSHLNLRLFKAARSPTYFKVFEGDIQ